MAHHSPQVLFGHCAVAATLRHLTAHIFQQIVDECADLRCFKAGGAALFCLQAVLHEVAEVAALERIHTRGRHTDGAAIECAHRIRRQLPAPHAAGLIHGLQHRVITATAGQILPKLTTRLLPCQFQRRGGHLAAIVAAVTNHFQLRKEYGNAVNHKGRSQLRTVQIGSRPADPQLF